MKSWLCAAAVAIALPAAVSAAPAGVQVKDAVLRASPPGVPNTAGYMTLANPGREPDRLLGASCACAAKVEAHMTHMMDGRSMMMAAGPVPVPAGGQVVFAPGGLHLMITGLKAPLKDGATQELVLRFERAGEVKVPFQVKSRIATPPASAGQHRHHD